MEMQNVELLISQRPDRSQSTGNVGGNRCNRAVGRSGETVTQRSDAGVRWWTVTRAKHSGGMSSSPQFPGQTEHLTLNPAWQGKTVRTNQANTHSVDAIFLCQFGQRASWAATDAIARERG